MYAAIKQNWLVCHISYTEGLISYNFN
jgi:hypothetical protein